jgi:hypothetical protein
VNHLYDRAELERDRLATELLGRIAKLRGTIRSVAALAQLDVLERSLTWHHSLRKSFNAARQADRAATSPEERRKASARREAALHKARRAPGGEITEEVMAEVRAGAIQQSRQRVLAEITNPLRALAHRL